MQENNYCVYKHTSPSNKVYIGITCQEPEKRWNHGRGYHQKYFKSAIEKYGWDNFTHEILFTNLSKEEAYQKEIELIAFYKSNQREFGYNLSSGGDGCTGCHIPKTAEHKKKIAESLRGRKREPFSEEWKINLSKSKKGKRKSDETKKKISESSKRTKLSEDYKKLRKEYVAKISASYKEYKINGGSLTWNEFQREYTNLNN